MRRAGCLLAILLLSLTACSSRIKNEPAVQHSDLAPLFLPWTAITTTTSTTTVVPTTKAPPPPTAHPAQSCPVGDDIPNGCSCTWALAYIYSHAPGFVGYCPHWALGHQAGTCLDTEPYCAANGPGQIWIWVVCWASVANEAWNSQHYWNGPYDPWGYCHY